MGPACSLRALRLRDATSADVQSVALLHAESWRRHYRGALSDSYLDGDVGADLTALWGARLGEPRPTHPGPAATVLAHEDPEGSLLGFVHVAFGRDPAWGALVDNLHVSSVAKRRGVGSLLMQEAARRVLARDPSSGLYLWVFEENRAAQAFYRAIGGVIVGRRAAEAPGGVPDRLVGRPRGLRCAWRDPRRIVDAR